MLFMLRDFMKSMSELGIKMDDYKYIDLCQEYNELVSKGEKREYNETINDPDCKPEAVLACWRAKMDVMGIPIHWERYM